MYMQSNREDTRSLSALTHQHTLLTHTHTTHPLPTHRIGGHDMQFCVASFQHIMQYIQVAIHNQLELS